MRQEDLICNKRRRNIFIFILFKTLTMRKKIGTYYQCSLWLRSMTVLAFLSVPFVTMHAGEPLVSPRGALQAKPADSKITGHVLDENGEPLIGVTVTVKGTNTVAITDFDGNFTTKVSHLPFYRLSRIIKHCKILIDNLLTSRK